MERTIKLSALQKAFSVDLRDFAKSQRNRSFPNASNCCKAKVEQKKFCSDCGVEVNTADLQYKLFKVGKEYIPFPKQKLDDVMERLEEMEDLEVKHILPYQDGFAEEYKENLMVAVNGTTKKKIAQYSELKQLLKGRMFVAEGVVRKNDYQILIYEKDNVIYLRRLLSSDLLFSIPESEECQVSEDLIKIESQILDKIQVSPETIQVSEFKNLREQATQEAIEKFVVGEEELPEITTESTEQPIEDSRELEKMKELLATM